MSCLPPGIAAALVPFAMLFSRRVWAHAQVLLLGALPAPAQRIATAALRATGHGQTAQFHRDRRVLSHARWSGLAVGRVLLALLVAACAPDGPLVFGVDETLERRRGKRIAAKGLYSSSVEGRGFDQLREDDRVEFHRGHRPAQPRQQSRRERTPHRGLGPGRANSPATPWWTTETDHTPDRGGEPRPHTFACESPP